MENTTISRSFFISLFGKHISDAIVFSRNLAMFRSLWQFGKSLFCSPLLSKAWSVCHVHACEPFHSPSTEGFSSILTLNISQWFLSRLWVQCVRRGFPRALSGLSSQSSTVTGVTDFTGSRVTPAPHLSKVSLTFFSSFSAFLSYTGMCWSF